MTTSISALVFTCALALATVQSFLLQFRFSTHSNALLFWSYRLPDGYEEDRVAVAAQQRVENDPALRATLARNHAVFLADEERAEEGVEGEVEQVVVLRVKRERGRDGIEGKKRAVEELQHLVAGRHPAVDSERTDIGLHVVDQRVQ